MKFLPAVAGKIQIQNISTKCNCLVNYSLLVVR